jgi:hypothetical protein
MKRIKEKTKKSISITVDRKICDVLDEKINNHSKYVEWLIYQDLLKNFDKFFKIIQCFSDMNNIEVICIMIYVKIFTCHTFRLLLFQ